jgi:hypothetical protein
MCDLVPLLGETPLGKNKANTFAQNRSITRKVLLMHRVRMKRLSPVRVGPYISLCWIRISNRQATVVSPLKWNTLLLSHRHD